MAISSGLHQLSLELDKFQIAAAIGHISKDVFVHWNRSFEKRLGLDESEVKRVELRKIILPDAPMAETSGRPEGSLPGGIFSDCVVRIPDEGRPEAEDLKRVAYLIDQAINDLVNAFTSGRSITEE